MPSLFLKVTRQDRQLFERLFQVSFANYFDGMNGLDVAKLDDNVIKSPDDKSMSDVVIEKYGQEADDLIHRLIQL